MKKLMNSYFRVFFLVVTIILTVEFVSANSDKPWMEQLDFDESFDSLDVTEWGKNGSLWLAHTPWNGDFGQAKFTYSALNNPFSVSRGILQITASNSEQQTWKSGLLALNSNASDYRSYETGYFEARMKFPRGHGLWPAFWLIGEDRTGFTAEIDIVEHYGRQPNKYSTNVHVWKKHKGGVNNSLHKKKSVDDGLLQDEFNLYGVDIEPHELVFYFNRKEYWRIKKPKEFYGMKFYPLVNLAMTEYNHRLNNDEYHMQVDYVRVYK